MRTYRAVCTAHCPAPRTFDQPPPQFGDCAGQISDPNIDVNVERHVVVDADSHWSGPPDLFTSRAPASVKDGVPRAMEVDGQQTWVFDGHPMGRFSAGGVAARDGTKESAHRALMEWDFHEFHVGAYDPKVRLGVLDECGIDAQVILPSTIGSLKAVWVESPQGRVGGERRRLDPVHP